MYGGQKSAMMIFGGWQMQVGQCAAYWVVSVDWSQCPVRLAVRVWPGTARRGA